MATEELKIIITADNSDVISKTKQTEKALGDVAGASGKLGKGAGMTSQSVAELKDSIESLRTLSIGGLLISNFDKVKKQVKAATAHLQDAKKGFSGVGSSMKQAGKEAATFGGYFKELWSNLDGNAFQKLKAFPGMIKFGAEEGDFDDVTIPLKKGLASLKGGLASAKAGFKGLGEAAKTALGGTVVIACAAAIAAVLALVAAIKNAITTAQKLKTTFYDAQKIGMSNASYEEWGYIMGQVGIEADKLSDFIKGLSAAQNDLRDGSEGMVKAFEQLGLSAQEAANMSQETLFTETVKRLQQMENQVERTGIAYRIFGEDDAASLTNILNLNNEEMERMINNFYLLGGSASDSAVQKSLTLQGAISNLKLAWQGLTNTLGEAFMPMITTVVRWITIAVAWVNMFVRAMLGYDIVAKGSKNVEKAFAGTTNGAKAATKAVEKLKRTTMGFDELNIVSDPNKSAGSGSDVGSFGGGTDITMPDLSSLTDDLGLEKMAEGFEKAKSLIQNIMPWFLLIVGVLLCIFGGPVGMVAGIALAGLGIGVGIESGAWVEQFSALWEGIKEIGSAIGTWFADLWNGIKDVASTVWNAIVNFFIDTWNGIVDIAKSVGEAIGQFFGDAWEFIKNIWSVVGEWFGNIWSGIKEIFGVVGEWFSGIFSSAWEGIKTAWNAVSEWFGNIWENIKKAFAAVGSWFGGIFEDAWEGIKKAFSAVGSFFSGIWEDIKSIFSKVGEVVGSAISDTVKTAINWILDKAVGLINGFIKSINWAIDIINKIPSVEISKIKLLEVPQLATGGIATGDTLAHIGEGGYKEAVLPLDRNTEWMDNLADRIAARNGAPSKIVLNVDGRELGWASINGINGITKQTGGLQLQLV